MLKLRPLSLSDLETRVQWMNDPRIYESMHFTPPITLEGTTKWFESIKENPSRMDFVLEQDGEAMVMNGLTGRDPKINKMESYTMVNPNAKAKGLGTKSLFSKSLYAFEIMKVNKIWAFIDGDNIASQKMCERIGYKMEGVLRQEVSREHGLIDRCYFGCLSQDLKRELFEYEVGEEHVILFE